MAVEGDITDYKSSTYETSEKETDLDMNGENLHICLNIYRCMPLC
jgi:hypothetical protein